MARIVQIPCHQSLHLIHSLFLPLIFRMTSYEAALLKLTLWDEEVMEMMEYLEKEEEDEEEVGMQIVEEGVEEAMMLQEEEGEQVFVVVVVVVVAERDLKVEIFLRVAETIDSFSSAWNSMVKVVEVLLLNIEVEAEAAEVLNGIYVMEPFDINLNFSFH